MLQSQSVLYRQTLSGKWLRVNHASNFKLPAIYRLKLSTTIFVVVASLKAAFFAVGCLMTISSILQISLISKREWSSLFSRVDRIQGQVTGKARSLSITLKDALTLTKSTLHSTRRDSDLSDIADTCCQIDMSLSDDITSKVKEE
jgi:hypothetical protein